ncbi:helix-turn-helix domain-containing protein [Burkholderia gladioli]|uniref:helix-turn-helix domain-containing protein n=1 Tax=Burkholderia gladioli TaxID=28095 RepID=UPI00358FBF0E
MRDERLRLGLSQDEFASVGGVARRTQSGYESGERSPDAAYLLAVGELGVDIYFVLRGERLPAAIAQGDSDEAELVALYRQLSEAGQAALLAFAASSVNALATQAGAPAKRAKRLPENRRAALDQRTAENVERAVAEVERARAERAARKKK